MSKDTAQAPTIPHYISAQKSIQIQMSKSKVQMSKGIYQMSKGLVSEYSIVKKKKDK